MTKLRGIRESLRFGADSVRTSFGSGLDLIILKEMIQMIEYTEK
ncbi:hypothetical protein LEP1GSC016_3940 [Leptospira borgpetersenii serovar Hardjo-bovis str. Sponselee]|uniref:Uncharacterized protein n=1 Tax=Leptospira borgpetersenii serovar Hardjo-bovis str. Sponselee TaxID=1303729 RepID=M6BUQ4_LEPBO|nr:hypothetical protein [Leptospira borgpetersenii]EMJ77555.1 hypothetical protein LEP1GSC016_3940 [Leptospira borgpetersenii serovar Hardjo-bovis str. Sponselee]